MKIVTVRQGSQMPSTPTIIARNQRILADPVWLRAVHHEGHRPDRHGTGLHARLRKRRPYTASLPERQNRHNSNLRRASGFEAHRRYAGHWWPNWRRTSWRGQRPLTRVWRSPDPGAKVVRVYAQSSALGVAALDLRLSCSPYGARCLFISPRHQSCQTPATLKWSL